MERVLYLPDTFTRYFEPEIESAALRVLAAPGDCPLPLPLTDAGRTLLSKGFLEASPPPCRNPARCHPPPRPARALPVIGLEPSELYTLRDELPDLLPARRAEAQALAARAFLIDEYLLRPSPETGAPRFDPLRRWLLPPASAAPAEAIVLHGHCYQKAPAPGCRWVSGGTGSHRLPCCVRWGLQVEIIPSGCCGMAGAFGYEAEHYELSQRVGELVLLSAVHARRAPKTNEWLRSAHPAAARYTMARQTAALHPMQLVAERLPGRTP